MPTARKSTAAPVIVVVVLLLLAPVLYIASIGPVVWLEKHSYFPAALEPAAHAIYTPFRFARDNCPPFRGVVDQYIALWTR